MSGAVLDTVGLVSRRVVRGEELELLGAQGSRGVGVGCLGGHSALHPSFPHSDLVWLSVLQAVMHVLSTKCFASFMW